MLSWRRFISWAVLIAVFGCRGGMPILPGSKESPEVANADATVVVARAAATVGHRYLGDPTRYPSIGDKPSPSPSPTPNPTPNGVCDLCDGKNWIGDGRPRNPCPKCNADGKKPPKGFTDFGPDAESADEFMRAYQSFSKLDRDLSDIISGETQREPVRLDARAPEEIQQQSTDADMASGESALTPPLPKDSSLADTPTGPAEEPAKPTPTVAGFRTASDSTWIDQWYRDAKPVWEKTGWQVLPVEDSSAASTRSFFVVTEPDGTVTRVFEYLNKDSLARAKKQLEPIVKPKPLKSATYRAKERA